jgi:hypothetical protein
LKIFLPSKYPIQILLKTAFMKIGGAFGERTAYLGDWKYRRKYRQAETT